jgi:hypothetical protein
MTLTVCAGAANRHEAGKGDAPRAQARHAFGFGRGFASDIFFSLSKYACIGTK